MLNGGTPALIMVSPKSADTMDHAQSSSVHASASTEISCVQPTSHISFGISFSSPGVKIMLWRVQNIKDFDYCLQAIGYSFFQIYFIFSASIGGYDVLPPYLLK